VYLIFYDDACGLCHRSINWIANHDRHHRFRFAPLKGETADKHLIGSLSHLRKENSLVLFENTDSIWLRGRAVMRIIWLLGGAWRLIGWLYKMPFINVFYRIVARHRYRVSKPVKIKKDHRFLD